MKDASNQPENIRDEGAEDEVRARREFLKRCGKYAVVVPPAMTLLLARDASKPAMAFSGHGTGDSDGSDWWKKFLGGLF